MADTDVLNLVLSTTASFLLYMLPIIGLMAGIVFIVSWLMSITMDLGRKTFKG